MDNIVIYGETEFAERIYKYIEIEHAANVLAFTNSIGFINKKTLQGLPVIPFEKLREEFSNTEFSILIAIGYNNMNKIRHKIYDECVAAGYQIAKYVSKSSILYSNNIGKGCIIMPGCYIGPDCHIGVGNIIASCTCLSHDNIIGDFNFISSGVTFGGHSKVGNKCFIGLNSTIKSGVYIDNQTLCGSATNVLRGTDEYGVYIGNPARKLENKNSLETKI